jgi:Spy/CpxP family protein refolding chaperone
MNFKIGTLLPAVVCGAMITSGAFAEDATSPAPSAAPSASAAGEGKFGNPLERLTKELSLTPDQQAKIKPILEARRDKLKALRDDTSVTADQKKDKFKEVFESSNKEIEAVLTPDQVTKFEALQKDRMQHRRHNQN